MTDKEAMKLALDALETLMIERGSIYEKAITALKERLADPMREVQRLGQEIECPDCKAEVLYECVACSSNNYPPQRTEQEPDDIASIIACRDMLDAQPVPEFDRVIWPERTWVALTDEEKLELYRQFEDRLESDDWEYEKAIEAKLKQKNGYAEEKNAICSSFMISELWKLHK